MAYNDYAEYQPELSPVDLATEMAGDATRFPHEVYKTGLGVTTAYHLMKQAKALSGSLPQGQVKYSGLPGFMGLRSLVGRDLGRFGGGGFRAGLAGAILGPVVGANPFVSTALGLGVGFLPKIIGKGMGRQVTQTGLRGLMELTAGSNIGAFKTVNDMLTKVVKGHTFGMSENLTARFLQKAHTIDWPTPSVNLNQTLSMRENLSRWKNAERGLVLYNPQTAAANAFGLPARIAGSQFKGTENLYKMMTKSPAQFQNYLQEVLRASNVSTSAVTTGLLADVTNHNLKSDIYELFTGRNRSAEMLNRVLPGTRGIPIGEAGAGGLMMNDIARVSTKGSRFTAAGRLGIRGMGVAAVAGIGVMGTSYLVSQIERGSTYLRDNLRSMNTALRLTEFGGRGSFMNDVVNTERDRAISAMQFMRQGRDFIGMEARLLAEGFSG